MIKLTDRTAVWRMAQTSGAPVGNKSMQQVFADIPCLVLPISDFAQYAQYAEESTDVVYLPLWATGVQIEDQLRMGRRVDEAGNTVARRYAIQGLRRIPKLGLPVRMAFVKERV